LAETNTPFTTSIMADLESPSKDFHHSRHERLKTYPGLWASVGVFQTFLTSGIIFGWASLLPVLRSEGVDYTAKEFTAIFTFGAVGNYLSTLFFGLILDLSGPRVTGIVASIMFALGLFLTSMIHNYWCLAVGFALLGFAGPGIQMPTLHLANLFNTGAGSSDDPIKEGGTGGGAIFMSAQAAAFDGGTAIFAILRVLFQVAGFPAATFLRIYMVIPAWVFLTSIFIWPDEILKNERHEAASNSDIVEEEDYIGFGSPYLSHRSSFSHKPKPKTTPGTLVNAPIKVVLCSPAFWSLSFWASVHILKLNFIVATINDQLAIHVAPNVAKHLIDIFGAMLPFGFVVLPIVASLLDRSTTLTLQLANVVGLIYGAVMVFFPGNTLLQTMLVFPSVATSRQLVFSTLFHQVGELFGFANYGTLLGLINLCVSGLSAVQTPLVSWSEMVGSYTGSNTILWLATIPLLVFVFWADPSPPSSLEANPKVNLKEVANDRLDLSERTPLVNGGQFLSERF
jgi:MFS family permease